MQHVLTHVYIHVVATCGTAMDGTAGYEESPRYVNTWNNYIVLEW